jgi:methylase of polypeptide subunit release factors
VTVNNTRRKLMATDVDSGKEAIFRVEEKPVDIYKYAVLCDTDPGQLVVDVFCGSGTVVEAALVTGRRAFASDIDPACEDVVSERAHDVDLRLRESKTKLQLMWDDHLKAPRRVLVCPPALGCVRS